MKLVRFVVLLLGLVVVALAAKYALTAGRQQTPGESSQAKRQLDNVRTKAQEIEKKQQEQVDEVTKKAAERE